MVYTIVMKPTITYVPGVCNIGPEEIARRRMIGWIGLLLSVILLAGLFATGASRWVRLTVFVPAAMSAAGFVQAYFHFCTAFAQKGVFNMGTPGKIEQVTDETAAAKDRARGNRIMYGSLAIALAVAVIATIL